MNANYLQAMRELDRERSKMEQQEKKIIADIKKMAKQGQMDAVKVMAKVCHLIQSKVVSTSYYDLSFMAAGQWSILLNFVSRT